MTWVSCSLVLPFVGVDLVLGVILRDDEIKPLYSYTFFCMSMRARLGACVHQQFLLGFM